MLVFLGGVFAGGILGVSVMCMIQISRLQGSDTEVGG